MGLDPGQELAGWY
jgi:hypothetical protein